MSSSTVPLEKLKFSTKPLFGGAISASVPKTFLDASDLRQIPDNQEVYLDANGLTSITFDILERVTSRPSDDGALLYHVEDLLEEDRFCLQDTKKVRLRNSLEFPVYYACVSTKPKVNNQSGADLTVLFVLLVRLERVETDLVVTVNVPYTAKELQGTILDVRPGTPDQKVSRALEMLEAIRGSLEVKDWGLFGDG